MTYATAQDVAVELGRPASSQAESDQWDAWLARAERNIARGFTQASLVLATQVGLGAPTEDDVRDVEVSAVLRKIANPSGFTSVTRSIDDATLTTRREGPGVDGDPLAITDAEWKILLPVASAQGGAFTVDTLGTSGVHMPWCALYFAALYCSCGADLTNFEYPLYEGGALTEGSEL
ncbi:MAG: hypothetical protein AVDCRST_MAG83-1718 [uncultured Arthrobacter sp.]|uniref:Uncharacterized protein n=1 Tax=uncultured Arthrobacter sp. TaxID=114050 RepID=A0A6J4I6P8_9MICC|nr:hypothetical protein [uncultured Arthrobacter sp.]CAA9242566.1 MAG: hypothetical protein AVDCRST_MAG83-1718 [uncultured Arthrobacter sp.]